MCLTFNSIYSIDLLILGIMSLLEKWHDWMPTHSAAAIISKQMTPFQ